MNDIKELNSVKTLRRLKNVVALPKVGRDLGVGVTLKSTVPSDANTDDRCRSDPHRHGVVGNDVISGDHSDHVTQERSVAADHTIHSISTDHVPIVNQTCAVGRKKSRTAQTSGVTQVVGGGPGTHSVSSDDQQGDGTLEIFVVAKKVGRPQESGDIQAAVGPTDHTISSGQASIVTRTVHVAGNVESDDPKIVALNALIATIKGEWTARQMWHRAEKSLTLQARAMCRHLVNAPDMTYGDVKKAGDELFDAVVNGTEHPLVAEAAVKIFPILSAKKVIETARKDQEKKLEKYGKSLWPMKDFVDGTRGLGLLTAVGIIGETGNLSNYRNPAKLWKRMGLAVIGGGRQRRVKGQDAALHGYVAARRSLMWVVGTGLIKAKSPLTEIYYTRKELEITKLTPHIEEMKKKSESGKYSIKKHAHNRAKRYMEKRLLREMWRAWRDQVGQGGTVTHTTCADQSLPVAAE